MLNRFQKEKQPTQSFVNDPAETQAQPGTLASRFSKSAGASPGAAAGAPGGMGQAPFSGLPEPEKELPKGATSWDVNGNPYFGEGIAAILKKWRYNYTKDVVDPSDDDWKELRSRWDKSMSVTTNTSEERTAVELEQVGMAFEAAGKLYEEGTREGSKLSAPLKFIGASVTAIGELFSIPAQKIEQGIGALEASAEAVNEVLYNRYEDSTVEQMVRLGKLDSGMDAADMALSSSENKWEYIKQKISDGWQAGRIYYSQAFNETLKEQYLDEYRAGKDPGLIAMKLQNPWAELGFQLILDPLNLVGAFQKASKAAKEIDRGIDATQASGLLKTEKGKEAFKAMQAATDDISGARALKSLEAAQLEAVTNVEKSSRILNVRYGADALTTSSRQTAIIEKGKDLLGNMALTMRQAGMSYDGVGEGILRGIQSVAKNSDEMREGLAGLSKLPNAHLWVSDDYIEVFKVLNKMMSSTDGVVDGGRLRKLMEVSDPATFADEAVKLMKSAASDNFKDVSQLRDAAKLAKQAKRAGREITDETAKLAEQYDKLPAHVKYLDRVDRTFSKYIRNPINNVLGMAYFNLQGGVAVRNIITNDELILIDKGAGAWFHNGKYWSNANVESYLMDFFGGSLPTSAKGFEGLVSVTGKKPILFGKLMQHGESKAAIRVVGASVRDTMKKMLPKAFPSLAADVEKGTLTENQARKLYQLIESNNMNVGKAIEQFRKLYKKGKFETWRNLDYVGDYERSALESMDLWRDIQSLADRGAASTDEIEETFARLKQVIDDRAGMAAGDPPGLSLEHPGAESWAEIMRAVEQGHLDPNNSQVFTALMESAEHVRLQYQDALDDVASKAIQKLNQEGRAVEAQKLGQEMNKVRSAIRKAGPATAKEAQEITGDAWRWNDEIKALKKPTPEELTSYWNRAGLAGVPPFDLNQKILLKELWKQRFQKVQQLWNASMDTVVGESETVLSQMDGIVDTTEIESMASRARHITQQAQVIRNTAYENGFLKLKPKEDALSMANRYGIPTASKSGKPNDGALLNIVNKYSDMPDSGAAPAFAAAKWKKGKSGFTTTVEGVKYEITADGQLARFGAGGSREVLGDFNNVDDAKKAFTSGKAGNKTSTEVPIDPEGYAGFEGGNPLTLLAKNGGVNSMEFSDVAGGAFGRDKASVMPGLFQNPGANNKGMGIDEAGRVLADNGFISKEQAEDSNFVREWIRKQMDKHSKGQQSYLEEVNDPSAPFYDEEGKLQNVPKDWKFQSLDEVPADLLKKALDNQRRAHGLPPVPDRPGIDIPAPHPTGSAPSIPRAWNENARGAKYVLDNIKNELLERWGKTESAMSESPELERVLTRVMREVEPKANDIRAVALRVATEQRDFTLLNYGQKTYGDIAKSYVLPYHFFYTKQYKNWIRRLSNDPEIVAGYGKYRENLESINADVPDWYKQQLNVNPFAGKPGMEGKEFLGIPLDHPLYINLESTLNPMYGLTGTDYFDKVKRNNWATATIDDMGKFGPSMWAPIQLGIAALLFKDGETEVASRWASRLFPQTAQIKAATSTFLGKPVELDPAVLYFNKGIDAQERGRMAYAAAELISSGQFTPEEVQLSFQQQGGGPWEAAYQMAVQSRAASSFSSYFLGVGFKPRSVNDVMVEKMYGDLNKLYAMSEMMAPEDYRQAWEQLRSMYPTGFVDTVLLSRKGGDKRDAALAYEVLNRIPPGNMSEALATIGLSQKEISKFYDSKGFTDKKVKFTKQEKDRFMAAVIDMATMLKIPDAATRAEWTDARTTYGIVYDGLEEEFGADIWDKVSHWYDLKEDDRKAAEQFGVKHPEIFAALQAKKEAVISDPILMAYYGGIDTIESYVDGVTRAKLAEEFGADIYSIQTGYYDAPNQRAYLSQHPELKRFWNMKRQLEASQEEMFYRFASSLPEAKGAEFQEGFAPQSYTQEQLAEALQQPESMIPQWEEVSNGMAPWLQTEVMAYAEEGRPLSKRAQKQMDFLADSGNYYNSKELLRLAVLALSQQGTNTGMTQPGAVPSPAAGGSGLLSRFANP